MRKIQLLFAVLAVFVAGAGVFANAQQYFATSYWQSAVANPNSSTPDCSISLMTIPCSDTGTNLCSVQITNQLPGEPFPTEKTYYIHKIVDANPCTNVVRP